MNTAFGGIRMFDTGEEGNVAKKKIISGKTHHTGETSLVRNDSRAFRKYSLSTSSGREHVRTNERVCSGNFASEVARSHATPIRT